MNNNKISQLLFAFNIGEKIADIVLRGKDFSDDEIGHVEKLGYIDLVETTSWGDRIYSINEHGILFRVQNSI